MFPNTFAGRRENASRFPSRSGRLGLVALLSLAALAGCKTNRDSITVGAIPDDYRTNHPITIAERQQVLDLPVGASEHGLTQVQQVRFDGFLSNYDLDASPVLSIMAPVGGVNEVAAGQAARELARRAGQLGVPKGRVAVTAYQSGSAEDQPPVRIVFSAMRAGTDKCGRWPADLNDHVDNKHYANFGCASQNNLAAQIANPADLLGPRRSTEPDAENRQRAITVYQRRGISGEFLGNSEINY